MIIPLDVPHILNGNIAAKSLQTHLHSLHTWYQSTFHHPVHLGVLLVGDHPASRIYIQRKKKVAEQLGLQFTCWSFAKDTDSNEILDTLHHHLNDVHGAIVQLPIYPVQDARQYVSAIPPHKDVDGLNPKSIGQFTACTPLGCWFLLQHYGISVQGTRCVVVGRSRLVGRPLAQLLLDHDATVTIGHSYTQDLASLTQTADILFVATGVPHLITPPCVNPNSIVIDIGIHRTEHGIEGDVSPDVYPLVRSYSPVPGGIGPMTVTALMWNTLKSAFAQQGIPLNDNDCGRAWLAHHRSCAF